jgi:hypothetical protein
MLMIWEVVMLLREAIKVIVKKTSGADIQELFRGIRLVAGGAISGVALFGTVCFALGLDAHQVFDYFAATAGAAGVAGLKSLHIV